MKLVFFLAQNLRDNHEDTKDCLPWRYVLESACQVYRALRARISPLSPIIQARPGATR
jgi:hypothetical protein